MTAPVVLKCLTDLFSIYGLASYIHSDNGPSLVCRELRTALLKMGVAYSNTTIYNPRGNGQCEKYNDIVWKSVRLAIASRNLKDSQWEEVLPSVLHSIRSLICTSTNETPHERLFSFPRKTMLGHALPSWLLGTGVPVLLRNHRRRSKYDPIVEEVELVRAFPTLTYT